MSIPNVVNETATVRGSVSGETLFLQDALVHGEYVDIESCRFCESMYGQRMIKYYPNVVSCIQEFQAIIKAEYPEIEGLSEAKDRIIADAYLLTMTEDRIISWEKILGIVPIPNSTLEDRRDTIIARIRGQGKLNTALINSIVNAFTGGKADSWVEDSVLYVVITPPPTNKQYQFANVEQELGKKVPAHLGFKVRRNYFTWGDIKANHDTWNDVEIELGTWNDVYLFIPDWESGIQPT